MAQTVMLVATAWAAASGAEFQGAHVCGACHTAIYRQQQASHHALSLRAPESISMLTSALPFRLEDRAAQATLELETAASHKLELGASRDSETARMQWLWAFGSGAKGITPVGRSSDGALIESRVSWYAASRGFSLTTGATRRSPATARESLGRALTDADVKECFGCHTSGYTPDRPEPSADEMGVRCERCHGAGGEHVRAMRAGAKQARGTIVHPGRLEAFAQVQLCGQCHGRPPFDSDVRALEALARNPNSVRFPSQRLMLSRCFNESAGGLACSGCHDPHGDVPASLDSSCTGCHKTGASRTCPKGSANCAGCHMPKESVMQHSQFADHWIRVVRRR